MPTPHTLALSLVALACLLLAPVQSAADEPAADPPDDAVLELELKVTAGEKSKDSSRSTWSIVVVDGDVTYTGPLGEGGERGRPAPTGSHTFTLDADQRANLERRVERSLLVEVAETHDDTATPYRYIDATVAVIWGERRGAIALSGMYKHKGDDTMTHADLASRVISVCRFLERAASDDAAGVVRPPTDPSLPPPP